MKFLEDFSSRTLEKRKSLIPKLEEARKAGKIAYFVADRLVVKDNRQIRGSEDTRRRNENGAATREQGISKADDYDNEVIIKRDNT